MWESLAGLSVDDISHLKSFFPKEGPLRLGIGRAGNVIGGGDWGQDRIVPDCVRSASSNQVITLRKPNATRPWQHVLEPLSGYINLALSLSQSNKYHGEAFNFSATEIRNCSVIELVESMAKSWENIRWRKHQNIDSLPNESHYLQLNTEKAKTLLKWNSVWNLEFTIEKTVSWYKYFYESDDKLMQSYSLNQIDDYIECARQKSLDWAL